MSVNIYSKSRLEIYCKKNTFSVFWRTLKLSLRPFVTCSFSARYHRTNSSGVTVRILYLPKVLYPTAVYSASCQILCHFEYEADFTQRKNIDAYVLYKNTWKILNTCSRSSSSKSRLKQKYSMLCESLGAVANSCRWAKQNKPKMKERS